MSQSITTHFVGQDKARIDTGRYRLESGELQLNGLGTPSFVDLVTDVLVTDVLVGDVLVSDIHICNLPKGYGTVRTTGVAACIRIPNNKVFAGGE